MQNTQNKTSFQSFFNKAEFADILATVYDKTTGTEAQYHMHQMIVCNSSDHFKNLCASAPVDELGCKLLSFDTTSRAFEIIGRWVYGNKDVGTGSDTRAIEEALEFANSAGMEDVRVGLLNQFLELKSQLMSNTVDGYRAVGLDAQWNIFEEICEHSLPRDINTVANFVAVNLPGVSPSPTWLGQLSAGSNDGFMAAILIAKHTNGDYLQGSGVSLNFDKLHYPHAQFSELSAIYVGPGPQHTNNIMSKLYENWSRSQTNENLA
ncbi:hypothetical protein TWF506_004375 [Arthrobotrys conoides]|uniref:BTB domain-containing protein n=1 Tax=Arthrobotrys conoides TaxID=74498 RepID=A0AAN8N2K6_9PEZI